MAWTSPRTYVVGEILTKALLDVHVRDNLQYLKDILDGAQQQTVTLKRSGTGSFTALELAAGSSAVTDLVSTLTRVGSGVETINLKQQFLSSTGGVGWQWQMAATSNDLTLDKLGDATPAIKVLHANKQVQVTNGTVGAPGLAFAGDGASGLYRSAGSHIGLSISGADAIRWVTANQSLFPNGTSAAPAVSFQSEAGLGMYRAGAGLLNFSGLTVDMLRLNFTGGVIDATRQVQINTSTGIVPLLVNRQADDGNMIEFIQGGVTEGSISVSGVTVSYNTFAGSHYTQLRAGQPEPPPYGVVVVAGDILPAQTTWYEEEITETGADGVPTVVGVRRHRRRQGAGSTAWRQVSQAGTDNLPYVGPTTTPADPRVYGVWQGRVSEDAARLSFGDPDAPVYTVTALGLYKVRVTDTGGNLAAGDLLTTSSRAYEAQRQTGPNAGVITSATLGKALVAVDWTTVLPDPVLGYKWRLIPAVLYAG